MMNKTQQDQEHIKVEKMHKTFWSSSGTYFTDKNKAVE